VTCQCVFRVGVRPARNIEVDRELSPFANKRVGVIAGRCSRRLCTSFLSLFGLVCTLVIDVRSMLSGTNKFFCDVTLLNVGAERIVVGHAKTLKRDDRNKVAR
jgi:hypothetical protein